MAAMDQRLARALGLFSLGLGAIQVAMPDRFARSVGLSAKVERRPLVRLIGAREIGAGAGLVARPGSVALRAARVAGDAMDIALLAAALRAGDARRSRVGAALAATVGVTGVDAVTTVLGRRSRSARSGGPEDVAEKEGAAVGVEQSITINRSRGDVYGFWRDFQNLPRFMAHLESVDVLGEGRSRWRARAPLGAWVEWEAEVTEDRPDELIAWRSLPGSEVANSGQVRFTDAPAGRGTEIHVQMGYSPPAGKLGAALAKVSQEEPSQQVKGDLRRLKQVLETGEVVRSDATAGGGGIKQRPAQPVGDEGR